MYHDCHTVRIMGQSSCAMSYEVKPSCLTFQRGCITLSLPTAHCGQGAVEECQEHELLSTR